MPETVGDLITEKKNNFCNHLLTIADDQEVIKSFGPEQIKVYKENIEKLRSCALELFIFWINKNLMNKKDQLEEYALKFMKMNGFDCDDHPELVEKYKPKIISYIKLFIDLLEYSFEEEK